MNLDELTVTQLEHAILDAVRSLGGSDAGAPNAEIDAAAADALGVPAEDRLRRTPDGSMTVLAYRAAWARTALKRAGLIDNVRRGRWRAGDGEAAVSVVSDTAGAPTRRAPLPPLIPWHRLTVNELLLADRQLKLELKRRSVIRGAGAMVGDVAEWLVAEAFDGTLADRGQAGYDVLVDTVRVQVKARTVGTGNAGQEMLDHIVADGFDELIAVLFDDEDLSVEAALRIPMALVVEHGRPHGRHLRLNLNNAVRRRLLDGGATDIADVIQDAAGRLDAPPGSPDATSIVSYDETEAAGVEPDGL